MRAVLIPSLIVSFAILTAGQEKPPERVAFDVASVRVNTTGSDSSYFRIPPAGAVVLTNATLTDMIVRAYEVPATLSKYLTVGGSRSILERRFDVQAVPAAGTSPQKLSLMLQTLLGERFGVKAHFETRSLPAYALRLARDGVLGPSLRASDFSCQEFFGTPKSPKLGADKRPWCSPAPVAGGMHLRGSSTIDWLLLNLQGFVDRPLLDETALAGQFEWELEFPASVKDSDANRAAFSTALREQLGLRLQPVTSPFRVLVVDAVTMPTPN